ncbi:hypothetical protein LRS12_17055 [Sphingomonas sp. J344]|nr:hypothetical protein [Sphingomonas sp. J344]MCR5872264.1 hypothetical protein [Sphingomonas sp. J344]
MHPWTETVHTPEGRYVDFKSRPDAIRATLEDLKHAGTAEIESAIVEFLRWANSSEAQFETNDFGLRPLKANESGVSPKPLEQMLRLTIFFRDLVQNTSVPNIGSFGQELEVELKAIDPTFRDACWGWCLWPHFFLDLEHLGEEQAEGAVIQLNLWGWGADADEVSVNLCRALSNLKLALQTVYARRWPS